MEPTPVMMPLAPGAPVPELSLESFHGLRECSRMPFLINSEMRSSMRGSRNRARSESFSALERPVYTGTRAMGALNSPAAGTGNAQERVAGY